MKSRRSAQWDGKVRTLFAARCKQCSREFWAPKHVIDKGHAQFCSLGCHGKSRQCRVTVVCAGCGISFLRAPHTLKKGPRRKHGKFFCARACKDFSLVTRKVPEICPPHYGSAKTPTYYRKKAFRWLGKACQQCGYNHEPKMLDVHHIDGNRSNDALSNFQVLCVWCHTAKTRGVTNPGLPLSKMPKPVRSKGRRLKGRVSSQKSTPQITS